MDISLKIRIMMINNEQSTGCVWICMVGWGVFIISKTKSLNWIEIIRNKRSFENFMRKI